MGRLNDHARAHKEAAIRAAMDRLLRGEFPPDGKCDVKTLASEAAPAPPSTPPTCDLIEEFERHRDQLHETGIIADPRDAQIDRLKEHVHQLKERLSATEQETADLAEFRTQALSRLAAQHEEITRLRSIATGMNNVREAGVRPKSSPQRFVARLSRQEQFKDGFPRWRSAKT